MIVPVDQILLRKLNFTVIVYSFDFILLHLKQIKNKHLSKGQISDQNKTFCTCWLSYLGIIDNNHIKRLLMLKLFWKNIFPNSIIAQKTETSVDDKTNPTISIMQGDRVRAFQKRLARLA